MEEQGAGKNQAAWTDAQTESNRRAETFRQQLIQLESGNADTQRLIKDDSRGIAGAWEGYQLSVTARLAEANPGRDYSDMIRRQAQDYALAIAEDEMLFVIRKRYCGINKKINLAEMLEASVREYSSQAYIHAKNY